MQELGRKSPIGVRSSALQPYMIAENPFKRVATGPAVQLIARDAFVSDTAIKLDQVILEIRSLGREIQILKGDIAEVREDASRSYRFSEFQEREYKARAAKIDDLSRRFDFLKTRLDSVDGNSKGDYQAFRTFEAVSRRLTELGTLEREFREVSGKLKLSAGLFSASVAMWLVVLVLL